MGGRPLEAMALIGLGIERLSITPAAVGPIKAMVRNRAALMTWMEEQLAPPPRDPVIGVIETGATAALQSSQTKDVMVIATAATVESHAERPAVASAVCAPSRKRVPY